MTILQIIYLCDWPECETELHFDRRQIREGILLEDFGWETRPGYSSNVSATVHLCADHCNSDLGDLG